MQQLKPFELTFGAVFICLMTVGANITVWFPILAIPIGGVSVPLSLQTFFSILTGLMLGRKLGSLTIIAYTMIGIAGVPVFANLSAGPMALIHPTGGFIISFIFVAYISGFIAEKGPKVKLSYYFAAIMGLFCNYMIGVSYMYIAMNTWMNLSIPYHLAWASMLPFLIKDGILSYLAAIFMIQLAKRVNFPAQTSQ